VADYLHELWMTTQK